MKCFIHENEDARCVCSCGKAMCIDCSAQTEHSGKCPNCLIKDYIRKKVSYICYGFVFVAIMMCVVIILEIGKQSWLNHLQGTSAMIATCYIVATYGAAVLWSYAGLYHKFIKMLRNSLKQGNRLL